MRKRSSKYETSVQDALDAMCMRNQQPEEAVIHPCEDESNWMVECMDMSEDRYLEENYDH